MDMKALAMVDVHRKAAWPRATRVREWHGFGGPAGPRLRHQFPVAAHLHHPGAVEDHDEIGHAHGAEAVGDENGDAATGGLVPVPAAARGARVALEQRVLDREAVEVSACRWASRTASVWRSFHTPLSRSSQWVASHAPPSTSGAHHA